jgi:hypothetical protein
MDPLRITIRNVNAALARAVQLLTSDTPLQVSPRGAATYEWPTPVITTYLRPTERVLFAAVRDANPFFHFFEALWMLAGRDDVGFVAGMVKRMATFSDDGLTFHGAYGHRWRSFFGRDQLDAIVALLKREPDSRRAVLGMWYPETDLGSASKDIPCNTQCYFKLRGGELRMTITCRSNDVIWGAYGANAVHFSMLQEYIAGRLGATVGPMYQLSDSWHIYTGGEGGALWDKLKSASAQDLSQDWYTGGLVKPFPMGLVTPDWDDDLTTFFEAVDMQTTPLTTDFKTEWWKRVALPMWYAYTTRTPAWLDECAATDWATAGKAWLSRRAQ